MVWLRQMGIAFGSLVAAGLVMWIVGGLVVPAIVAMLLVVAPPFAPLTAVLTWIVTPGTAGSAIVTLVLGGLIYRDIMRREHRWQLPGRPTG